MRHLAILALLAIITIHVPDELIDRAADWFHFSRIPRFESKAEFVTRRAMEQFIPLVSFGRFKTAEEAGISVEVR